MAIPSDDIELRDTHIQMPLVHHGSRTPRVKIEKKTLTWILATWPLAVHFFLTLLIAAVMCTVVNRHNFSITSRRPEVMQADGSVTRMGYTLLQTDVTTALSFSQTIIRSIGAMWTAPMMWRCIYILLEEEGLSLTDIGWMLKWHLPAKLRGTKMTTVVVIAIIILFSIPSNLSSPILTGSITWRPVEYHVSGLIPVEGIAVATDGMNWDFYTKYTSALSTPILQQGAAFADMSWGRDNNSAIAASSMKRVLPSTQNVPIGSILDNVTVPYFIVDEFTWTPDQSAPAAFTAAILNSTNPTTFNPFLDAEGPYVALLPDGKKFGPSLADDAPFPNPTIVSKTTSLMVLVDRIFNSTNTTACSHTGTLYFGDVPPELTLYPYFQAATPPDNPSVTNCQTYANITYRAGVATCTECIFSDQTVVEFFYDNDTLPDPLPDAMTELALTLTPMLGKFMLLGNMTLVSPYNNINNFVTQVVSRSYQMAWTALTNKFQSPSTSVSSSVEIVIQLSEAEVAVWRVYVWLVLNLLLTLTGPLFFFVQGMDRATVIDSQIAVLLLNPEGVLDGLDRDLGNLSMLTDEDSKAVGRLGLEERDGKRCLKLFSEFKSEFKSI